MLFLIETEQTQKNVYVVEVDPPFTKEDASAKLDSMRDLSQQYQGEKVINFKQITTVEYLKMFDELYPDMKNLDRTSKLLQISDINDSTIESVLNGKDEL